MAMNSIIYRLRRVTVQDQVKLSYLKYSATGYLNKWKNRKKLEMCASKILKMKTKSW